MDNTELNLNELEEAAGGKGGSKRELHPTKYCDVHQIVEGVYSARAGKTLADRYGVDMPIVQAVNGVLFENKSAAEAVHELMQRVGKDEIEGWE